MNDPVTVKIGETAPVETVSHALYPTTERLKKDILIEMIKRTESGRMLVFTRTKHRAQSLASILQKRGHNVTALQGNMAQNKRQQAITGFKKGKYDILVATDIAARGIDISDVSHVINYDMPSTVDAYTHRIGRTGRALRHGWAYTLATQADEQLVSRIERVLDEPIERRTLEDFDYGGYNPEHQGPRLSEKKPQHSRSDGRGGMNAPEKRRSFGGRPRRISRR